jgi:plasmid stabilization system protein ParE
MSRQLVFHPDVADEVNDAYRWYESRRPGLGDDSLDALEAVDRAILVTPEMHQVIEQDVRRSLPRRFPYAVYYRVHADRVEVIAVQHGHRDPAAWRSRI